MEIRPIDANALIEWIMPYLHTGDTVEVDTILEDIRAQPTLSPQWISVEDRLPESEKPVLTFVGYPESMIGFITVSTYYCFDKTPHWQWDGLLRDEQRTLFWMPLPQPPKEAQP